MTNGTYGWSTYEEQIRAAATRWSIPWTQLAALIQFESRFDPNAISSAGAVGLGQIMPFHETDFPNRPTRSELLDPEFNIEFTAQFWAAALAPREGDARRAYSEVYNPLATEEDFDRFAALVADWGGWDYIQEHPDEIPEGGVLPPDPFQREIDERRAFQEPIQDAEPYYEGYLADVERQKQLTAVAYNSFMVGNEDLARAQRTASFWNVFRPVSIITGWRPPGQERPEPAYLVEWHKAQEAFRPIAEVYYLEQLKLHTYWHLPEGVLIGEVLSPQDAIDFLRDKVAAALGEEVAMRAISPEYEAFVTELFHKLSYLRYDPGADCEDLVNALTSPTRPRPMAFGVDTPAGEIIRRQRLPTTPEIAEYGTFQEYRDTLLACGIEFPEEMLSVKKSWEDSGVEAVELITTQEMIREGLIEPRLPSLTSRESLMLAVTQPGTALLEGYKWYFRRWNAPLVTWAWEKLNRVGGWEGVLQRVPGGRPWEWEHVPDERMAEYDGLKSRAMEAGMTEVEARIWAWQNMNIAGINRFIWEIVFDPANLLAVGAGGVAGIFKGVATGAGYEGLGRVGYGAIISSMNAPNDLLAAPFLAGKRLWKAVPKTPFGQSRAVARAAFGSVDSFLVRAFPGKWPRMSATETFEALSGAIDDFASSPYAVTLTPSQQAGYSLTRIWRYVDMNEAVAIATKLGVSDPDKVITQAALDQINDIWRKVGISEANGLYKPREAAELLLEVLGHRSSPALMDIAENIWYNKQEAVIRMSKSLLKGRTPNSILRNWFERVADTAHKNYMDYDWRFAEGGKFMGRSLRVGDMISKLAPVQWAAGINRRFASWVLYFPNFGPMNYMETMFRSHRMGVGWADAAFPSRQAFSELQVFAGLNNFPYEFRAGVAPPRLTGLLMGDAGESLIDDMSRLDTIYKSTIMGKEVPFITKPAKFPRDIIKRAPWLKRWNDLPDVLKMLPGSAAWNDWWGFVGQAQRAESILASFDRNLVEAAPDAMRAIDELMPPFTRRLEGIESLVPREVEEISHAAWRQAQVSSKAIREGLTHDPNWYRRARFVNDVQEAAEHFPHLERNIVDQVVGMTERGEFTNTLAIDDGFDRIMRSYKQGWLQKMDDAASRIRFLTSQVTAARVDNPTDLMAMLRSMEDIMRIHDDVLHATRSAVTEGAHDVAMPTLKDAMHQTQYLTQLQYGMETGRSIDYTLNLLDAQIRGKTPPVMDWGLIEWSGIPLGADEGIRTYLESLPYDLQVHVKKVSMSPEITRHLKSREALADYGIHAGEVRLREIPTRDNLGTFFHETAGHGWAGLRSMQGDTSFFLDASDALHDWMGFSTNDAKFVRELLEKEGVSGTVIRDWYDKYPQWRRFEESFADTASGYITAPQHMQEVYPEIYNFFEMHMAYKLPDVGLTPEDAQRAVDFLAYLRQHRAITVVTRDKVQEGFQQLSRQYEKRSPTFWSEYYSLAEKEWAAGKAEIARLHTVYGARLRLQAAGYDALPTMEPIERALTMGDLADVSGLTADSIRVVKPESFLLMSEEEFTAFFRGQAGAVGMDRGLADNAEEAADLLGFTREEVGRVYRDALREIGLEPSVATPIDPTLKSIMDLRDEVKLAHSTQMIPPEDVARINAAVDDLASRAEGVYPEGWTEIQESAMGTARGEFELEHVNITDANVFDATMKSVFPFWTYESQRWPWLFRTFVRSPHVAANLGRYMNYTDRGYIHIPGTDLRWNPWGGTIAMSAFARLQMRDYPEYADLMPGLSEPIGAMMRMGFYPGFLQTLPFVFFGAKDRNKRPQLSELLPAFVRSPLDAFLAKYPDSEAARILREQVFPDRFRDYYTMQMVDKIAFQRGIDIYGLRLWEKMEQGIALTADEQSLWNEASGVVSKFGVLSATTGWFTLRPEERKQAYEASAHMIEEFTGIPRDMQEEAMRHYAVTGKRLSDVFPLAPFEKYMLREVEKINRFALTSYTTPLMPSGWQKQRIRTGQYWDEVETIWDTARHSGWVEDGFMSLDYLERAFTIGTPEYPNGISAADYAREVGRTLEHASSVTDMLGETEYYRYDLATHDGVPKTMEERVDYYEYHGIPMPTYHPLQELLYSYYDLTPELKFNEDTGAMERDFDSYYAMASALIESIPDPAKAGFMDRLSAEWTPMRKLQWAISRDFFQPYRAIREAIVDTRSEEEQKVIRRYARAPEPERDELRAVEDEQGLKVISQYTSDLQTARKNIRMATPELDAWLLFWGRTSTVLTPAAKQMYQNLLRQYRPIAVLEEGGEE